MINLERKGESSYKSEAEGKGSGTNLNLKLKMSSPPKPVKIKLKKQSEPESETKFKLLRILGKNSNPEKIKFKKPSQTADQERVMKTFEPPRRVEKRKVLSFREPEQAEAEGSKEGGNAP